MMNEWIQIASETNALPVPGGMIVRTWTYNGDSAQSESVTFVPRPREMLPEQFEEWIQAMHEKYLASEEEEDE